MKMRRRQRGAALLLAMIILTMVVTVTTGSFDDVGTSAQPRRQWNDFAC